MTTSDALVFFGATGDLAHKMIFPALQALTKSGRLDVPVIGVAKAGWDLDDLRKRAEDSLRKFGGGVDKSAFKKLSARLKYIDGDYNDPATFSALKKALGSAKRPLCYLAIPPSMFATVVSALGNSGCAKNARVVVEKPFGRDRASAAKLNSILHTVFDESSIFRIDHYLGKEAVQNLLYFRFANSILEPIWNRNFIDSIQITMAETFGIKGRGPLYEETGAIRDVVQNHLLQTVACLAMEAPGSGDSNALRDARTRVLQAIDPIDPKAVTRGQFRGYKKEKGVSRHSQVETFVALRLGISSWRWAGVPFFIRAGKCLPVTCTEVLVRFRPPPLPVFGGKNLKIEDRNCIRLRLGPDVATAFDLRSKKAGESMEGQSVELLAPTDVSVEMMPYERLLGDAMNGDPMLFASEGAVEASWRAVDPILTTRKKVLIYEPGTWGPKDADRLTKQNGGWHDPVDTVTKGSRPA